ncbi:MAG: hypothetical protein HYW01_05060 [Deltaproteobacteria bacterium]|nr:hypothetical protein [Deltaproteobacteria bacterium]
MKKIDTQFSRSFSYFVTLMLILAVTGCSVKFVADYDEVTDKSVTELQRKVERFLVDIQRKVGTDEAAYSKHTGFYDEVRVDLSAIRVRAAAREKNEITLEQLDLIQKNLDNLEKLHELGFNARTKLNLCVRLLVRVSPLS